MAKYNDELLPTRATLLGRIKDLGDESSWREFFDIYWKLIYGFARKEGLSDAEAQDAVQETMVSVAKHMPGFQYNPTLGSFKGWLFKLTRWRIVDQKRKRGPIARNPENRNDDAQTATIERFPDDAAASHDAAWEADYEKTILDAAMERTKRKLDPKKWQIFDVYANHGWPAEKVAATFNITANQVYINKTRVTEMLREEITRLEKEGI